MKIWLTEIWHTWSTSLRKPGFLLLASTVLAMGVGASAAVLTLIDDVLLRPLPFAEPSRLVAVGPILQGQIKSSSPEQYRRVSEMNTLQSLGLYEAYSPTMNVLSNGTPEVISALRANRGLLPTLGVSLALGRNFSAEEDRPNGPLAVILTYGFWQHRFAGRKDVIGNSLQVEGMAYTVIGVLPQEFMIPGVASDIVLPTALPENSQEGRNYRTIARLAGQATVTEAAAQIHTGLHAMYEDDDNYREVRFGAHELKEALHAGDQPVLMMFLASAMLLLLIALVNLVNLMLLRALARSHDTAVRSALGAPALRLALPTLAEALLVGIIGALLGMGLATLGIAVLRGYLPPQWVTGGGLRMGPDSWLIALLLGMAGALLATIPGLLRRKTSAVVDELREGGRSGIGRHNGRLGRGLVVVQVAMATALLSAAGLFLHKLYNLSQVPLGFASQNILTFELSPVKAAYPDTTSVQVLAQRVVERLRRMPGVIEAAATTNLPAGGPRGQFNMDMHLPGNKSFGAQYRGVEPGFFQLFNIRLLEGRSFERTVPPGGEPVAVINQAMADAQYGGRALGQKIERGEGATLWSARIIGVVADTRQFGPVRKAPEIMYVPLAQMQDEAMQAFRRFQPLRFAVKVNGSPFSYRDEVRKTVGELVPTQPINNLQTMDSIVSDTTAALQANLLLIGIFAALALLLAGSGLYAVMAVSVEARQREFAVRLALGSSNARLVQLVLRSGLAQIGLGLLCGIGLAVALSKLLSAVSTQMGSDTLDPLALAGVCVVLAVSGVLASLAPAWKATRVPPMRALRGE